MNKILKHFLATLLPFLLFSAPSLYGQAISAKPIPRLDKLPVSAVHRIFQDSEGYIWYGTVDGLCRDDGYNIHVFRSDIYNPGILSSNSVTSITEDSAHNIWFGTWKGAYILNKSSYKITPVNAPELIDKDIQFVHTTSDGSVWISIYDQLYRFNTQGVLTGKYDIEYKGDPAHLHFLFENKNKEIWIAISGKGICKLDPVSGTFEPLSTDHKQTHLSCILQDKDKEYYWIGTRGKGILRFTPEHSQGKAEYVYQPLPVNVMGQTDGTILYMVQDDTYGYLWVTTLTDLFAFRITENNTLEQVNTSQFIPQSNKMLNEIIKDKDGNLWVSAFDQKSFILNFKQTILDEYPVRALQKRIHGNPAIIALCKDEDGVFWLSQERIGLCIYQAETDHLSCYSDCQATQNLPLSVVPYLIKSHQKGKVWVMNSGTHVFGLSRKGMEIQTERTIDLKDFSKRPDHISMIFEDTSHDLWIGTTSGLYIYRPKTDTLETVSDTLGNVSGITETSDETIWITLKNKGICAVDKKGAPQIYPFKKDFLCIASTSDGKLWLGTGEGEVLLFDPARKDVLTDYSFICGMNGDMVDNMVVDTYNHIWIVTNQKIKEFNPRNGAYRSFAAHDPIPLNRFLPRSAYKSPNGTLYFGGIPGIISMPPTQQLESIPQEVKTYITNVKIMGQSILSQNTTGNPAGNNIQIRPGQQNLEIEFSSLDYHHIDQIRYAYRLVGMNKDWVYPNDGRNVAFYNELNKGKYAFQVKATDKNGLWSNKITEITIHRLPYFYETWWAYTLYFILLASLVGTMLYIYLQRVKLKNEKKLTEQVTQMKLRYFTNISHELLTPLTVLSCLADEMESSESEEHKQKVSLMQTNLKRLKRLLQQVLDFRKLESKNMKLFVEYGNLSAFIHTICEHSFMPLAKRKDIRFSFSATPERIEGYYDKDKLDKILFNLLSNAFKYTPSGKEIKVDLHAYDADSHTYLRIQIKDAGIGIERKELDKIFTRFYSNRLNDAGTSNGIGLSLSKELTELHHGSIQVQSQPGMGSEFTVQIPIDKASYTASEFKNAAPEYEENLSLLRKTLEVESPETPTIPQIKPTLLIAEDNEELLLLMQSVLTKTYHVLIAGNGTEALEIIKSHKVDLVVSDIVMPGINGLELCRTLKNTPSTQSILVVLLTAQTGSDDRIRSYEAGADAYLSKPFEVKVLKARLESLLQRKNQQETARYSSHTKLISAHEFVSQDEQLIKKALKIVEKNLANPNLDVVALADELHMSRSTFARKIKTITGHTPLDFIKDIKMQHALNMLKNRTTTVSEVVVALGYSDHRHFTSSFKDTFGMTPSEYQKRNRTENNTQ